MDTLNDRIRQFLSTMDSSFRMRTPQWVLDLKQEGQSPVIIDVRERSAFEKSHIRDSINIPLAELPSLYEKLLPDRESILICACNGSVQSAYAIMYLYARGYKEVYNLSGGVGRWQKEGFPMKEEKN